ncbi:MAG: hypothetical protein QNJ55_36395 [Xenococcus sp. MO_188.B8]|nr:hypothetical protein [Xenococcus sp. MO_188.B8]
MKPVSKFCSSIFIAIVINLGTLGWASKGQTMEYQDNSVSFSLDGGTGYVLLGGSFTIEEYSVTEGQDPDGHIKAEEKIFNDKGSMTFSVGRQGSSDVAEWFHTEIHAWKTTFNHEADDLNFAFRGTLKLKVSAEGGEDTYTFSNIGIAQGHSGRANNWWFGGEDCIYLTENKVSCYGTNSSGSTVEVVFQRGDNPVNIITVSPTTEFVDTRNWMGKIKDKDNVALDEIMMPGSHDAGMSETEHCSAPTSRTKTQSLPIQGQLESGSRYFDIRVDYDHGELVTYHRDPSLHIFGCNGQKLETILNETRDFLGNYPTEMAILRIGHIRYDEKDTTEKIRERFNSYSAKDTKEKINELLNSYSEVMYGNTNEKINLAKVQLGDVQGKMIVVLDYSDDSDSNDIDQKNGRFSYEQLDPKTEPLDPQLDLEEEVCKKTDANANIMVCEKYADKSSYDDMEKDQLGKWDRWADHGKDSLFLLSWTLTGILDTIENHAKEANSKLPGFLHTQIVENGKKKPNIVYIDYVNSKTTQSIIQYNF